MEKVWIFVYADSGVIENIKVVSEDMYYELHDYAVQYLAGVLGVEIPIDVMGRDAQWNWISEQFDEDDEHADDAFQLWDAIVGELSDN